MSASAMSQNRHPVVLAPLRPPEHSLPVPTAEDRLTWDPSTGTIDRAAVAGILQRAEDELGTPWPVPLASQAARVHRDGDRETWENIAFGRQRRLSRAVTAAAVTLSDRWLDEVADGTVLLCEQSSWCWPAHDDTLRVHGSVLATVTDPFIDLGAGEVVAQLAWIDHLLGTRLDQRYPGLRSRIRYEARARVIDPFLRRRDWHWIGLDGNPHNWNPWIHGNILVAALRLLDGPDEEALRSDVVALSADGLDRYIAALPQDGAIDEGYAYWWNGACRTLEALDLLAYATHGTWDVTATTPALRETVAFPHRMHLGGGWYVNLADGPARPSNDQAWHSLHRAARRVQDTAALAHAAAHRTAGTAATTENEGLGRLLRGLTDREWLDAAQEGAASDPALCRDVWLPSVHVMIARERAGSSEGLTVVAKGGHNAEHHNHNDVGSFVVASDGVPVIVDAGRPTYTAATFGPARYDIWTMQSSWHNVPEIRGEAQVAGREHAARHVHYTSTDASARLDLDLAQAYPASGVHTWRRSVRLDRALDAAAGGARVSIDDRWRWNPPAPEPESPTTLRLLLAGRVNLMEGSARITPLCGARVVTIAWPEGVHATTLVRELDDPMLRDVWGERLIRLELDVSDRTEVCVTIEQDPTTGEDHR